MNNMTSIMGISGGYNENIITKFPQCPFTLFVAYGASCLYLHIIVVVMNNMTSIMGISGGYNENSGIT
jgi:hypothetical protein